jgi:polar amino acid transport system substrate-binding protein/glutamate/aspartate transport system substrate-binding protein
MIRAAIAAALLLAGGGAAADALDRIRERGEIRLAVREDAAPLSSLVDGVHQGYAVDVCRRLSELLAGELGLPSLNRALVPVDAETRFAAVAEGRADLLCGAASVTLQRRETVDFSIPIFVDGAAVLTRAGAAESFDALAGQRIGVRSGTTTERSLRATLERLGMAAEVIEVGDHAEGVAGVREGAFEAYFADQSILYGLLRAEGGAGLQVSGNTLSVEPQALAMARGETALRLAVDRALSRMWRDGEMGVFFEKAFAPAKPGDAMRALAILAPIPE